MDDFIIDRTYEQNRRIISKDDQYKYKQLMTSEAFMIVPLQKKKKHVCKYCLSLNQNVL